jgi:hypothetical protein
MPTRLTSYYVIKDAPNGEPNFGNPSARYYATYIDEALAFAGEKISKEKAAAIRPPEAHGMQRTAARYVSRIERVKACARAFPWRHVRRARALVAAMNVSRSPLGMEARSS